MKSLQGWAAKQFCQAKVWAVLIDLSFKACAGIANKPSSEWELHKQQNMLNFTYCSFYLKSHPGAEESPNIKKQTNNQIPTGQKEKFKSFVFWLIKTGVSDVLIGLKNESSWHAFFPPQKEYIKNTKLSGSYKLNIWANNH